jgi:hypothetical protein
MRILRHRLAFGDERDGPFVEFALARIHHDVVGDHSLGKRDVVVEQRLRRRRDHRLRQVAHVSDQTVDLAEFLVEGGYDMLSSHCPCPLRVPISRSGR